MKTTRLLGLVLASAFPLLLGACFDEAPEISTDVATPDLRMGYQLVGTSEGTKVKGYVLGPGVHTRLVEGDRLELRTPLGIVPLTIVEGEFSLDLPAAGGDFELALLRPAGRGGDLSQKSFLAPPFGVRAPITASRAAALTIVWDAAPGSHQTQLGVSGPCIANVRRNLSSDVGSYTFNPYELASSAAAPGTCTVKVDMVKGAAVGSSYSPNTQSASTTLEMTP